MNIKKITTSLNFSIILIFSYINLAQAQFVSREIPTKPPFSDLTFNKLQTIIDRGIAWMFTIFMLCGVIFFILAAFKYLGSKGDGTKVKEATKMLTFTAIAIAVAISSAALGLLVKAFLGV